MLRRAFTAAPPPPPPANAAAAAPRSSLAALRQQLANGPDFGDFVRGRTEYAVAAPTPKVRHTRPHPLAGHVAQFTMLEVLEVQWVGTGSWALGKHVA